MNKVILIILILALFPIFVYSADPNIEVLNDKIYIEDRIFLIEGVDYAPWLNGTGPDPYLHSKFPDEYDDITPIVSSVIPDINNDSIIQAWEVVEYDLRTIKSTGANTIRTYAAGEWHDKDLDGIKEYSGTPEQSEFVQGDVPDWVHYRIIDFAEKNHMKVIIGYWIGEEDFVQINNFPPYFYVDFNDLKVANDTMKRVIKNFGNSSAVIAWAIGNEVLGTWHGTWFAWDVSRHDYLNQLYDSVRQMDSYNRPIMYSKYVGEDFDFINLNCSIMAINAYIHTADALSGEFTIPATGNRAYILGEFAHNIDHADGHWDLSKEHAGGLFLEYNDVWWKGANNYFGIVEVDRDIRHDRYDVLKNLFYNATKIIVPLTEGWNMVSTPLNHIIWKLKDILSSIQGNYSKIFYYSDKWNELNENSEINNSIAFFIKSLNNINLTLEGETIDYTINIPLNPNYNLIPYPNLEEINIDTIINNCFVFSYNNSTWFSYDSSKPFFNTLNSFVPGYGYWINVPMDTNLTFYP